MKRFIACLFALVMCVSVFAACSNGETVVDTAYGIDNAASYLSTMYQNATEATPSDYTVVGVVKIDGVTYNVEWTCDSDTVNIVRGDDNMVTIDVDETNPEEVSYTLTATISDDNGETRSVTFFHRTPAAIIIEEGMSYAEIVDVAYSLEAGLSLEDTFRLYGTITSIDTAYSADYKNITVTIVVDGKDDMPIMCYRLKGDGCENLAVGDAITVEGTFTNYNGTIEFAAGCAFLGYGEHKDQTALLDAAYSLEAGISMTEETTLVGEIVKIDTAWSEDYQNITVTIDCGDPDRLIQCFRLKGEGAKELAVGDRITVTGTIKNYNGTIEFDSGCSLDAVVKAASSADEDAVVVEVVAPSDPAEIVDAAYALAEGETLPYTATLCGTIISIDTEYSADYGNITVTIVLGETYDKPIQCFRLKGDGCENLAIGNQIVVTGTITNYAGTIEFNSGCTLDVIVPTDPAEIVEAAFALEAGASLPYSATLDGIVASIDTEYSEQYGNITVTITVIDTDKNIQCFRLKGEGAEYIAVGDYISVNGTLMNYNGTVQFGSGCTLTIGG